jgi:hypothetical protein
MRIKGRITKGAIGLALTISCASGLSAKSDVTLEDTLKWIDKHHADLRAEWHTTEGPVRWQPDDFKDFAGTKDWFWDRTIRWTAKSECPKLGKGLETDGETYSITRSVSFTGNETDVSEQEATKDASHTRQVESSSTWRLKISQISPEPKVLEYKEYLQQLNQKDERTVDVGTYYYVCIYPKPDAGVDAIVQVENDKKSDDGQGHVTVEKSHVIGAVAFAPIATVHDKAMADRLSTAVGHLIGLLRAQEKPKEPF